jgi:hypothetical protein
MSEPTEAVGRCAWRPEECSLAGCGTSLPEQDALVIDPGNPWRFLRSIKWKKAMQGFFHEQLDRERRDQRPPFRFSEPTCTTP